MSNADGASDDESAGPRLPQGVLRSRGGWQGDHLEMEHQLQADSERKKGVAAAVDLDQFRNFEVGKGYQAKHVHRQASAAAPVVSVKDMSSSARKDEDDSARHKKDSHHNHSSHKKRKRRSGEDNTKSEGKQDKKVIRLQRYLQSSAMRRFRKELAKIESQK